MPQRAIISVWPYRGPSFRGWSVAVKDPKTDQLWQRLLYYKTEAKRLAQDLRGKSLEEILDIYGVDYFIRVL